MPTDNSSAARKTRLRQIAIEWLGGPSECRVLDTFAGSGFMRSACYGDCKAYLGIDIKDTGTPGQLIGDNRVLAPAHADHFNLFDCDAYNNPWILCDDILQQRTKKGRIVMVTTCNAIRLLMGVSPGYHWRKLGLSELIKFRQANTKKGAFPILRWHDDFIRIVLTDWRSLGFDIGRCIRTISARSGVGHKVRYYAVELFKL